MSVNVFVHDFNRSRVTIAPGVRAAFVFSKQKQTHHHAFSFLEQRLMGFISCMMEKDAFCNTNTHITSQYQWLRKRGKINSAHPDSSFPDSLLIYSCHAIRLLT